MGAAAEPAAKKKAPKPAVKEKIEKEAPEKPAEKDLIDKKAPEKPAGKEKVEKKATEKPAAKETIEKKATETPAVKEEKAAASELKNEHAKDRPPSKAVKRESACKPGLQAKNAADPEQHAIQARLAEMPQMPCNDDEL